MALIDKFVTTKNKYVLLLLTVIILVGSFTSIWPIRLIEGIVNLAIPNASDNIVRIFQLGLAYFAFQIMGTLFSALSNYISAFLQNDIGVRIQNELYSKLLKVKLNKLEGKNSLEITNTLIEDTDFISSNLILPFTRLFSSIALFVIGIIIMLNINAVLTLIILPCGLVTSLSARAIQNKSRKNISEKRNRSNALWKTFAEGIRGIAPIRIYRYDSKYRDIVSDASTQMKEVSLAQSKLENINYFFVSSLFMITIGIIMIFSSVFVIRGYITIGSLTAVLMYNHMLIDPLINVLNIQQNLIRLTVSLRRTSALFDLPDDANAMKKFVEIDSIELRSVSYAYDEKSYVLENIDLCIAEPSNICVMGKSGSGKTTLANLIAGLYSPIEGEIVYRCRGIEVDGVPRVSYLIQDGYLFDASITQNIQIANPSISDSKLEQLRHVCLLDDIFAFHKDNPIGENGCHLSGGERKRVRIAQMLANDDADVYIFDELTSSLDEVSAGEILKNILNMHLGKICVFIEHDSEVQIFMDSVIKIENAKAIQNL